jgi:hypothetical protein
MTKQKQLNSNLSKLTALLILALSISTPLLAGTLDDAPFRVVVPNQEWRIDDSTAQPMGQNVFLAATITNTNTQTKSVIIKAVMEKPSATALDELCAGIRSAFANPAVKKISETDTTFLGHKAKTFAYQVGQGAQATYNETTVFVEGTVSWTIACVGRADQKEEVKKIIAFYRKKGK